MILNVQKGRLRQRAATLLAQGRSYQVRGTLDSYKHSTLHVTCVSP